MAPIRYQWSIGGKDYAMDFVFVAGSNGSPYSFGHRSGGPEIELPGFYIGTVPVTQALWTHITGIVGNRSANQGLDLPLENISWDGITEPGGLLERINQSAIHAGISSKCGMPNARFRLPTETEWEYAARGGPHWRDGFQFSGSDDINAVAWYGRRHGDHTQPVALKAPNQLGIYDMSGNVWEWCRDSYSPDTAKIPTDGSPYEALGSERVLRGGCFHNWAIHCTVSKRYEIASGFHDGCIRVRVAFS